MNLLCNGPFSSQPCLITGVWRVNSPIIMEFLKRSTAPQSSSESFLKLSPWPSPSRGRSANSLFFNGHFRKGWRYLSNIRPKFRDFNEYPSKTRPRYQGVLRYTYGTNVPPYFTRNSHGFGTPRWNWWNDDQGPQRATVEGLKVATKITHIYPWNKEKNVWYTIGSTSITM